MGALVKKLQSNLPVLNTPIHRQIQGNERRCISAVEEERIGAGIRIVALPDQRGLRILERASHIGLAADAQKNGLRLGRKAIRKMRAEGGKVQFAIRNQGGHARAALCAGNCYAIHVRVQDSRNWQMASATSVVATFSPFHRNVSPMRSTK